MRRFPPTETSRARRLFHALAPCLTICLLALGVGCATMSHHDDQSTVRTTDAITVIVPESVEHHEVHHPLPPQCASGCDVVPPAMLLTLEEQALDALMAEVQSRPVGEESDALHQLLFYADQTRVQLDEDRGPLDEEHAAWLGRELAITSAEIAMRVRDEEGIIRASLPAREVPLGKKQHLSLEAPGYGALVASGTLLRVSTYYVWTRI
jgi:hypothetical protein